VWKNPRKNEFHDFNKTPSGATPGGPEIKLPSDAEVDKN
jgi:hypothetical protein